jgi:hypothetical protein
VSQILDVLARQVFFVAQLLGDEMLPDIADAVRSVRELLSLDRRDHPETECFCLG